MQDEIDVIDITVAKEKRFHPVYSAFLRKFNHEMDQERSPGPIPDQQQ